MSTAAGDVPSLIGPRWACERCGWPCAATAGHQSGCKHYRVKSPEWQAKRRELLAPVGAMPMAAVAAGGQQGLAL